MYITTHLVFGAAVGGAMGSNLPLAFSGGLISHIFLDLLPHHDYRKLRFALIDVLIALILFRIILTLPPSFIWGSIGGVIPDLEVPFKYSPLKMRQFFPSHSGALPHRKLKLPWGFLIQVFMIIIGFGMIKVLG